MESELDLDARLTLPRTGLSSTWSDEIAAGVLRVIDFASVVAAGMLSDVLLPGRSGWLLSHLAGSLICGISVVQSNALFKLYDATQVQRLLPTLDRIFSALVVAFSWVAIIALLIDAPVTYPSIWKVGLFVFSFALIASGRLAFRRFTATLGERRVLSRNIVVVGAGEQGQSLLESLGRAGGPWTHVVGVFDDRARGSEARVPNHVSGHPVLGTTRDLVSFSRKVRVDEIFIALPWTAEARINDIVNTIQVIPANVHLCPDVLRQSLLTRNLGALNGIPVATLLSKPVSGWGYLTKWVLDKTLALVGLIVLAPFLLFVALLIKLESPGPVLFRQPRLGFNNRLIMVYKFRSMYHALSDVSASQLATRNDPRVTRLGRILRKLSIDELPQLLNVLLGDMSLVGPRPHAIKAKAAGQLYREIVSGYAMRHKIKPGITGWAQVSGWRGETDTEEKIIRRVEYDLFYMNNWSVLFDLVILVMTVFKAPFSRNAY